MKRFIYFFLLLIIHSLAFGQTYYGYKTRNNNDLAYRPLLNDPFALSEFYSLDSKPIPCVSYPRYPREENENNPVNCPESITVRSEPNGIKTLDYLGLIDYETGFTISSFVTVAYVEYLKQWRDSGHIRTEFGNIVDTPYNRVTSVPKNYYMLRFFPNVTTLSPATFNELVQFCFEIDEDRNCIIKHPRNGEEGEEDYYYGAHFITQAPQYPNGSLSHPHGYGIDENQRFYFQTNQYASPINNDSFREIYTRTKDIITNGNRKIIENAIKEKFRLLSIDPDNCTINWASPFDCVSNDRSTSHQFTIHTIVGYSKIFYDGGNAQRSNFPISSKEFEVPSDDVSLKAGVKVVHENITESTEDILLKYNNLFDFSRNMTIRAYSSKTRNHPRALLEGNYDFITKLNSGEVYNKDYTIQKTQEDGTVVDYIADLSDEDGSHSVFLDQYDKKLEVRDHICTPTTSIFDEEEIEDEDCTHDVYNYIEFSSNLTSDQIESVKTLGKEIFPTSQTHGDLPHYGYGADCISQQIVGNHYLSVENDTSRMLLQDTDGNIIWEKKKTDPHNQITCLFPTQGTSSLTNNQRLIQYNKHPSDISTEKTYLLSADKTKITIKDGNLIKVITKTEYEAQKGVMADITPLQSYSLN